MTTSRTKPAPAIALAAAFVLPLLLVLGARTGTGQDRAGAKPAVTGQDWTAESHDRTNFPLVGKHRTVGCRECHINLVFEGTPTDCEVCHWQRRQDDRYSLRLGTRCSDCHTPQAWKKVDPALWSHEANAGYRLEGIHRTLDCEDCHGSGGFTARSPDCFSCHESDYRGTRDPNHVEAGFPTSCPSCHDQRDWENASFEHTGGFVLQGRHASASCSDCHENGVYQGTSSECASCHLADYQGTDDPDHGAAGFPLDCSICHGTSATGWEGASFEHTVFVRRGSHATASCSACHANGVYQGTPSECVSCHLADYNGTTDPNHRSAGFPLDCEQCHGTSATGWSGAIFDHDFPIQSGRHAVACSECHQTSDYRVFSCLGCHGQTETNNRHSGVTGYSYSSQACYGCHPQGQAAPSTRSPRL